MFTQRAFDRRRFLGTAALSVAAPWIGTRDSVLRLITVEPFSHTQREWLGIARQSNGLAQFSAADRRWPARQSRARRLLHVHLHQLAAAITASVSGAVGWLAGLVMLCATEALQAVSRLRGRPPFAPLAFGAAAFAFDRRRPPRRPVDAANKWVPNARSTSPGT